MGGPPLRSRPHSRSPGPQLSTWHVKLLRQPQLFQPRTGTGCHAIRGSVFTVLLYPLASPGMKGFAFHPLRGQLHVTPLEDATEILYTPCPVRTIMDVKCGMKVLATSRANTKCGDPQRAPVADCPRAVLCVCEANWGCQHDMGPAVSDSSPSFWTQGR